MSLILNVWKAVVAFGTAAFFVQTFEIDLTAPAVLFGVVQTAIALGGLYVLMSGLSRTPRSYLVRLAAVAASSVLFVAASCQAGALLHIDPYGTPALHGFWVTLITFLVLAAPVKPAAATKKETAD